MYRIIQLGPANEEELSRCFSPSGNIGGYFPLSATRICRNVFKAYKHISFGLMKLLACRGLKDKLDA
jgi:hypothetical protein